MIPDFVIYKVTSPMLELLQINWLFFKDFGKNDSAAGQYPHTDLCDIFLLLLHYVSWFQ